MLTFSSRIKLSNPAKFILLLLCFSIVIWILLGYFDDEAAYIFKEAYTPKDNTPVRPPIEVPKVTVDVYYECLCPDSRYFVTHQLYPAWQVASEIMKVNFWPYGKATTEKTKHGYKFNCQHGEKECEGDMIHACAAHLVSNADLRMEYIKCMVSDHDYDPEKSGATCAKQIGVDWSAVSTCANNYEGQELHAEAGLKTNALEPKVSFIPTIEIDSSQGSQKALLKNFLLEVCKAYQEKTGEKGPQGCIDILAPKAVLTY